MITFEDPLPIVKALPTWHTVRPGVCWYISGLDRVIWRNGDILDMANCTFITFVSSNTFKNFHF